MKLTSVILALALTSSLSSFAVGKEKQGQSHHQTSPSAVFSHTALTKSIHLLQGKGGNIVLYTSDHATVMIDDDYADMSKALQTQLSDLKIDLEAKPFYLINTHWHGDHTGGNDELGAKATIVAHHSVRERLSKRQEIPLFKMVSSPYAKHALPTLTFDSELQLHLQDTLSLYHMPNAHTDGDAVVMFKKANVMHTGDLFFNGIFPFVDLDSGGRVSGMIARINDIMPMIDDKTQVVPGHGPLAHKQDLLAFQKMLIGTQAEVKRLLQEGKSLADIQKQGLSRQWQAWGKGFLDEKTWISIVVKSLQLDSKG